MADDAQRYDTTDPALLTEEQLRHQLASLGRLEGTSPDVADSAALRLRQLNIEYRRRAAITFY
jgi:hypothetical protein